jgi:hypothetical protein
MSALTSNGFVSAYNVNYATLNSIKPQYIGKVYQRYNQFPSYLDAIELAGQKIYVPGTTLKWFEEGPIVGAVTLTTLGTITVTNNTLTLIVPTPGSANSGSVIGKRPLRIGDSVFMKLTGFTYPKELILQSWGTIGTNVTNATFGILDSTVTGSAFAIDTAYKSYIGANKHGANTYGTEGLVTYPTEFSAIAGVVKEAVNFAGRGTAIETFVDANGGKLAYDKGVFEANFRLRRAKAINLWGSEKNTSNLKAYDRTGNNTNGELLTSTQGLLSITKERGTSYDWNHTDNIAGWQIQDLNGLRNVMLANSCADSEVNVVCSPKMLQTIEEGTLAFAPIANGGTNFQTAAGHLGIKFRSILKSNVTWNFIEATELADPNSFGATTAFDNFAIAMPQGKRKVKMNDNEVSVDNLTIGYVSRGKENRELIMRKLGGMNGLDEMAVTDGDFSGIHMLSDYLIAVPCAEQNIIIDKLS